MGHFGGGDGGRQADVSGSADNTLQVWDLERGKAIRTLEGHSDGVTAVAVTADGKRAVSGSDDKTLKLWDLNTGEEIATFAGESAITACAISPDGTTITAGEASGCVHFLELMNPPV